MTQEEKLAILNAKEVEVFEAVRDTGAKDEALPRLLRVAWDVHMLTECLEDDEPVRDNPKPVPETPEPEQTPEPDALTFAEVKKKMIQYQTAHNLDIAALMQSMGYQKLSEIPAEKYDELLRRAEAEIKEKD